MSEQEKQEETAEQVEKPVEIAAEELDDVSGGVPRGNTYRGLTTVNDGVLNNT